MPKTTKKIIVETLAEDNKDTSIKKLKEIHAGFWSFSELYIIKQLSTILHIIAQIGGSGYLLYYAITSQIYLLILALPVVWIGVRAIFEIIMVPFTISYDLDRILRKLSEKE